MRSLRFSAVIMMKGSVLSSGSARMACSSSRPFIGSIAQSEITRPKHFWRQLGERARTIVGIVDVVETELMEQVANDPHHGFVVVDHQDRCALVHGHGLRCSSRQAVVRAGSRGTRLKAAGKGRVTGRWV